MSYKLYMKYQGNTIPLGKFKNSKTAVEFYEMYLNSLKSNKNSYPRMFVVESRKKRG